MSFDGRLVFCPYYTQTSLSCEYSDTLNFIKNLYAAPFLAAVKMGRFGAGILLHLPKILHRAQIQ